jgi:hypothetical protein
VRHLDSFCRFGEYRCDHLDDRLTSGVHDGDARFFLEEHRDLLECLEPDRGLDSLDLVIVEVDALAE